MNIVCIGDCGVDRYSDGLVRPGGITLNFAVHAKKLFPKDDEITVISALGNDNAAKIVEGVLESQGITSSITKLRGTTAIQEITIEKDGERTFTRYLEGVLADFTPDSTQTKLIQKADFVVVPLFTQVRHLFDTVINIKKAGTTVVDFNDLSEYGKSDEIVEKYIDRFEIGFFGLKKSEKQLISSLETLARKRNKLFVITLGAEGSTAYSTERFSAPAMPVREVVDTTGAGDSFAASFLNSYIYSKDVGKSLQKANEYASHIVQLKGSFVIYS